MRRRDGRALRDALADPVQVAENAFMGRSDGPGMRGWTVMLALCLMLAGCTTEDPEPASDDLTTEPADPGADMNGTAEADDGNTTDDADGADEGAHDDADDADGTEEDEGADAEADDADEGAGTTIDAFDADVTEGDAPLDVAFTMEASSDDPDASWSLDFGDGETTEGMVADLPGNATHTYGDGTFDAVFTVTSADDTVDATLTITAVAGEPPQTEFTFGESAGCASDANAITSGLVPPNCVSFHAGPGAPEIDGHWIELDERYVGMTFLGTMETPSGDTDTDCFLLDADLGIVGEGHNGGGPCTGTVEEGVAWMFLYPWGVPATGMTLTFT